MSQLRRAFAGASATAVLAGALVAGSAAPAAAEHSSFCPEATSTRLLTVNHGQEKLWLYKAVGTNGSDDYHLCYASATVADGDIVVRTGITGSLVPVVDYTVADPSCPNFFTLQDPVQAVTELGLAGAPYTFCFGVVDNQAVRVTFGLPTISASPRPELWVDRYSSVGVAYCNTVNDSQCSTGWPVRVV